MINIKCDLGFCDEWTEYNITNEELEDEPNSSLMYFSVHNYQGRCETHGITTNITSVCRICEENDYINSGIIKRPTHGKDKHLTKI